MLSEEKIKHILWNHLEKEGYDVGGEVRIISRGPKSKLYFMKEGDIKVLQDENHNTIIQGEENICSFLESSHFAPSFGKKGEIVFTEGKESERIDLIAATDRRRYFGYEVKGSFDGVSASISTHQFKSYKGSGKLDYLYVVIPRDEYEHIESSHGEFFDGEGIGLICISKEGIVSKLKDARGMERCSNPVIKENEAWLKQKLWNYFQRYGFEGTKYDIEGEGIIPVPELLIKTFGKKWQPTTAFQLRIDLCLITKGKDSTFVVNNQDEADHIGIEVKYKLRKSSISKLVKQLYEYAESRAITKLFLAVMDSDVPLAGNIVGAGSKFGVIGYDASEERLTVHIDAPKLQMEFDGFGYRSLQGLKIWKFGDPTFISVPKGRKYIEGKFSCIFIYDSSKGSALKYHDITYKIDESGAVI